VITDELKNAINAAMQRTNGNVGQAALLLELRPKQVSNYINNNKDLRALWRKDKSPPPSSEAVVIHRPTVTSELIQKESETLQVTPTEAEIAEAIRKEDAALARGLDALGLSASSRDAAMALQKFHNRHFTKAIDMIGGGITKLFLDLMVEIDKINRELETGGLGLGVEREEVLRKDRQGLLEAIGRSFDRVNKATLTQAIVKSKMESGKGKAGPNKPGFSPLTVKAENVQVNMGKE
jgi:hypothetical protein